MSKGKMIYIYDPVCSWCYAFSGVMQQIKDTYQDKIPFEIWSGGMVLGDQIKPIGELADFLKPIYKRIESMTPARFGDNYYQLIEEGTYVVSSELASVALTAFKELQPENAINFAHDIQKAYYHEGKSLNDIATFIELASPYGIDGERYAYYFQNADVLNKTNADFQNAANLGVRGFPTLLYDTGGEQVFAVARGYTDLDTMTKLMNRVVEMEHEE